MSFILMEPIFKLMKYKWLRPIFELGPLYISYNDNDITRGC